MPKRIIKPYSVTGFGGWVRPTGIQMVFDGEDPIKLPCAYSVWEEYSDAPPATQEQILIDRLLEQHLGKYVAEAPAPIVAVEPIEADANEEPAPAPSVVKQIYRGGRPRKTGEAAPIGR